MVYVSNLGMQLQSLYQLLDNKNAMADLSSQLATGKKSTDLTYYGGSGTQKILDMRGNVTKRESYSAAINAVSPRLSVYSKSLEGLANIANQAQQIISNSANPSTAQNSTINSQVTSYMQNVSYYLNQRIGDRCVFSGSRYSTLPVGDITQLPNPPLETSPYTVANPALPSYDSTVMSNGSLTNAQKAAGVAQDAKAWDQSSVTVDDGLAVQYGVSSNDPAFQQLVMGLRYIKAAATSGDQTTYKSDMATAQDLITKAMDGIRTQQGNVAANQATLNSTMDNHKNLISELKGQVDDVQSVDIAEVSTRITYMQTQLQASYSVTAKLADLSLTKYL